MQLSDSRPGVVLAIEPFTIHDQPNVAVRFRLDGDEAIQEARLAAEAVHGDPHVGDRVQVQLVLGEAFEIRRV